MTRTFNVLDAGCSAFISYFTTANFQKYITYNITLFKTFGSITICSEKLSNYEFEPSRDFPKIGCWLPIKKHLQHSRGLFEFAQQTSSAGAASVSLFDTFAVYFLLERKLFGYFLVIKSNMNKKVNKDIITNYKDCKYYKKVKKKQPCQAVFS